MYKYSHGDVFYGTWSDGMKHGSGIYVTKDGTMFDELYEDGLRVERKDRDSEFHPSDFLSPVDEKSQSALEAKADLLLGVAQESVHSGVSKTEAPSHQSGGFPLKLVGGKQASGGGGFPDDVEIVVDEDEEEIGNVSGRRPAQKRSLAERSSFMDSSGIRHRPRGRKVADDAADTSDSFSQLSIDTSLISSNILVEDDVHDNVNDISAISDRSDDSDEDL